ncbi:ribonuclease H-like domain-containing protein [Annulohypoxylon bovei var. microspora]|nr:ribonuclease H-like domain-containing protein [Annulohypoxylon bovei var. microspora]
MRAIYMLIFLERKKNLKTWPVVNVGSRRSPTYLPAELCKVVAGQRTKAEVDTFQRDCMIKFALRNPLHDMKDIIPDGMKAVGLWRAENPMMDLYGLSVPDPKLVTVKSRVLPAPTIRYSQGGTDHEIRWNLNSKRLSFDNVERNCSILYINHIGKNSNDECWEKLQSCYRNLKSHGVNITGRQQSVITLTPNRDLERDLMQVFKENTEKIDCMIVVLPDQSKTTYNCVKRLGDTKYGVATVCIIASTLTKVNPRNLAGNLALKFNLKFRNINQTVSAESLKDIVELRKTMVVGIDVTHSPDQGAPSIAGMVASVDEHLGQWPATLEHQEKKGEEMVKHLSKMLKSRIEVWASKNKNYPENILIYRDGVSEGQYDLVRKHELPQLQETCKNMYQKGRMPKITIIVVGKRHHTRFYDRDGEKYNPRPGTVVDRGVTEALNWDFFLVPHSPFKGTARPSHYFVVHDEIFRAKFKGEAANQLETFTHSLCFLFGRSTGAVSICTPAYYADIVCQRARCYADDSPGMSDLQVHPRLRNTMFYI